MASNTKRDTSLDFISGLLIIHMILGHTMAFPFIKTFNYLQCVFFFYMPWFFFKSGMFYKHEDDFKSFITKKVERLIKPFIFFSLLGEPFFILDSYTTGFPLSDWYHYTASFRTIPYFGNFAGNPPCWFLLSLFVIFVAFNLLIYKSNKILCTLLLLGLLLVNHFYNPFPIYSITHTISGCLFFILGYVLKELQYQRNIFIVSLLVLVFAIPFNSFVGMAFDLLEFGNYILWYLFSLAAIIVVNKVAKYIPGETSFSKFFVWVGQNSMLLLVVHWPILIALKIAFLNTGIITEAWQFVLVSVLSVAVLTPILHKLISKIKFIKI